MVLQRPYNRRMVICLTCSIVGRHLSLQELAELALLGLNDLAAPRGKGQIGKCRLVHTYT